MNLLIIVMSEPTEFFRVDTEPTTSERMNDLSVSDLTVSTAPPTVFVTSEVTAPGVIGRPSTSISTTVSSLFPLFTTDSTVLRACPGRFLSSVVTPLIVVVPLSGAARTCSDKLSDAMEMVRNCMVATVAD